ncbi:hypothetical protein GCM10020256_40670 [Streptomyces thermocoprophilus]
MTWVGIITVLFMLPQVSPVTWETFNYAPVAVLAVLAFAGTWWLTSARHWLLPGHHPPRPDPPPRPRRAARHPDRRRPPGASDGFRRAVSPIPDRRHGPLRLCSGRQHRLGP